LEREISRYARVYWSIEGEGLWLYKGQNLKIIHGWREKLLSRAGKEIFIKAVAQAIPTFHMSCFYLTKVFFYELSAKIAKYWWSGKIRRARSTG
jgi:hypothetical protein